MLEEPKPKCTVEELLALGVSESEGLLDRADALVWALTALMLGPPPGEGPRVRSFDLDLRRSGISGYRSTHLISQAPRRA